MTQFNDTNHRIYEYVADELWLLRQEAGFTQLQVSDQLRKNGISLTRTSISNIERGVQHPSIATVYAIAAIFGADGRDVIIRAVNNLAPHS